MKTLMIPIVRFAAIALVAGPAANAALLAFDGFDYGASLANDALISEAPNGGSGFTTVFSSANVNWTSAGLASASTVTVPIGGAIRFDPNDTLTQRAWGNMSVAPDDGTYWYSLLFTPTDSTTPGNGGRGTFNIMSSTLSTNGQNGVGLRLDNANTGADLQLKALAPNGGTGASFVTVAGGYGATYFIVGRMDMNSTSGSTNRIWVNPTSNVMPLDTDPNSVAIGFSAADSLTLRPSLAGRAFGTGAGGALFEDEVRIGTTINDVMVIPETSTSLLGLLGVCLLIRRRR